MICFLQTQLFISQDINWWTGVVWITCGLLWCFYQLFGLSFWRHPFTTEDPLVSKWRNTTFLRCRNRLINSPNSSSSWMTWGWVHFRLSKGWNISGKFPNRSRHFGNFPVFFGNFKKIWEIFRNFRKASRNVNSFCNPSKFSANFHFWVNHSFNDCCQTYLF